MQELVEKEEAQEIIDDVSSDKEEDSDEEIEEIEPEKIEEAEEDVNPIFGKSNSLIVG